LVRRLEQAPPAPPRPRPAGLALETVDTPHGPALRHREDVPLPPRLGRLVEPVAADGTVFLDTETTGLAGGTGTYVFLVGLAAWEGGALRLTQYFLGDLGAEAAFLHAVGEALGAAPRVVTFNGRTFDLPLLETRYLLARAPWRGGDLPHDDLYPVARALWRDRVTDCRLATLELALLGLDRGDDLPGAVVPHLYFRYLRARDPRPLPRLFAHNRWDLVALAALAGRAADLLRGPGAGHDPREWLGAGRWLERRDPSRSARFYEAAVGADLAAALRARAARRLGGLWRRAGQRDAALALLHRVAAGLDAPPLGLLVDLAKLLEHHARDYAAALAWTRVALARAEADGLGAWRPDVLAALARRAARLARRAAARGRAAPAVPAPAG
jgi:uncharacterized protein YprB with RNaseH-like and TPR domain